MLISSTSERLKEYMNNKGLKQADILRMCEPYCKKYGVKMGRNDLSQYVSGKVVPKQDKTYILALALNVSEPWLMGYDVDMHRIQNRTSDRLIECIKSNSFTEDEENDIIKYIEFVISKRK